MNDFLQFGLGLVPAVVTMIYLLLNRKIVSVKSILFLMIIIIPTGVLLTVGGKQFVHEHQDSKTFSKSEIISMANAFFNEKAYEQSWELLDEYNTHFGYDNQSRLLASKLHDTEGDFQRANGLNNYLASNSEFNQSIKEQYNHENNDYQTFVESVVKLDLIYQSRETGNDFDEEILEDIQKNLSKLKKTDPKFSNLDLFSKTQLKANILEKSFEGVVRNLSNQSNYHEIMIASELYMSDLVKNKAFPENYTFVDNETVQILKKIVNKIEYDNSSHLTIQEANQLNNRINAIKKEAENPILSVLKSQLTEVVESQNNKDMSKIYLELAKIESYLENETSSYDYINKAIYKSQESDDDIYASAMGEIINVINQEGIETSENIKNVAQYVEQVIDNALTIDLEGTPSSTFNKSMVDFVSRTKTAITVNSIDTSNFDQIKAYVKISSNSTNDLEEFHEALEIFDCGVEIKDYTLEKVNYEETNFLLLCDVSGSMDSNIQELRESIFKFIEDRNKNENIGIITFNKSIVQSLPIGSPDSELHNLAENIFTDGGTDMFSALKIALDSYQAQLSHNNLMILITDGRDSNPQDSITILNEIGKIAVEKGVTIYTMGLGDDVDTSYLSTIANSGNGDFIYVSDESSLASFYNMLHSQVNDVYEINYHAVDTMTTQARSLEVVLPTQAIKGSRYYNINDSSVGQVGGSNSVTHNLSVSGLSSRTIYKGKQDIGLNLVGTGFKEEFVAQASLKGKLDYRLDLKFLNDENYTLMIPASVAKGTYDVEVIIDGRKVVLNNGFTVLVQGEEKRTTFGAYQFTSLEKIYMSDGGYVLRGAVTMNGWLKFKGDIILTGDLINDGSIRMEDWHGSYVEFDSGSAEGLGSYIAKKGIHLDIPSLGAFTLYNDPSAISNSSEYLVDDIKTGILRLYDVLLIDSPVVHLYPDYIELNYQMISTILPFQDKVFEAHSINKPLFNFQFDGSGIIDSKNVGIKAELGYTNNYNDDYQQVNVFNNLVYLNLNQLKLNIDTLSNEYLVGAMIKIALLDIGVGADVAWSGPTIDAFKLYLDKSFKGQWGPLPVTYSEFSFGASGINEAVEAGLFRKIKLNGSLSIATGKIADYAPKMKPYLGDISLFELPDTSFEVGVSPFSFEAQAQLTFLEEITLAKAGIKLGTFKYSQEVLNIDEDQVKGIQALLETGFTWDPSNRVLFQIVGKGTLDANTRFVGVSYKGTGHMEFNWWLFNSKLKEEGTVLMGMDMNKNAEPEFILSFKYHDSNGKIEGKTYRLNSKDEKILN